jgi:hypothetical protein
MVMKRTKLGSGVMRVECVSRDEQASEVAKLVALGGTASESPLFFPSKRAPTVTVRTPDGQLHSVEDWGTP